MPLTMNAVLECYNIGCVQLVLSIRCICVFMNIVGCKMKKAAISVRAFKYKYCIILFISPFLPGTFLYGGACSSRRSYQQRVLYQPTSSISLSEELRQLARRALVSFSCCLEEKIISCARLNISLLSDQMGIYFHTQ